MVGMPRRSLQIFQLGKCLSDRQLSLKSEYERQALGNHFMRLAHLLVFSAEFILTFDDEDFPVGASSTGPHSRYRVREIRSECG